MLSLLADLVSTFIELFAVGVMTVIAVSLLLACAAGLAYFAFVALL